MKFKVGDKVLVTAGKDKGVQGPIVRVMPELEKVVVEGANFYTRHVKPMAGRAGDKVRSERPMSTAKISIINDKGQADRIGYQVAKDGQKIRVYKKTGAVVPENSDQGKKK
jgi:large subunit ribosomal protein L24